MQSDKFEGVKVSSVWVKKPAFPYHFFVYEVLGSKLCMSAYHHIGQLVVQDFFPKRSDFPGKWKKMYLFCFHCVTKTHQDKTASQLQVSVCPSG